jgi:hypothetical protein
MIYLLKLAETTPSGPNIIIARSGTTAGLIVSMNALKSPANVIPLRAIAVSYPRNKPNATGDGGLWYK